MRKDIEKEFKVVRKYHKALYGKRYLKALFYKIIIKVKGY